MTGPGERPGRLGLRSRLIATFALGALCLSMLMGALAYFTARHTLIVEQQGAALRQAYANAALLRNALAASIPSIDAEVTSLDTGRATASLLNDDGRWFSTSLSISRSSVPASLRNDIRRGHVATVTTSQGSSPLLMVGVPIPAVRSSYYLVVDLSDLEHTLRVLLAALAAAAGITTVLGALVGLLASRRTMRPLTEVSAAAASIATGDLTTRLPVDRRDPDLGALSTSFNAMVDQLEDRIERDARFTSDVSHELRSPLTTLAASLEVLESNRTDLPPRADRAVELMAGDLRRFQRMVADLLEISRLDAGSGDLILDEVVAGELVRQCVGAASRDLPEADRPAVRISDVAERAILLVDKRRVERIITNLLENARLYAGGATEVVVDDASAGSHLTIAVVDAGPGIPPEERTKVFERFYRGVTSGRRGATDGSGLGLALVAEHVQRLGGDVAIEDGPDGIGSAFVITLPISEEPAS
jgi:signal transduction histidine kinase